jgi:hypothetical protein
MGRNRTPNIQKSDWTAWSTEIRSAEVERLDRELAESRAREHRARYEAKETRERFERLLDASRRFTRTLSDRRRQQQTSRQYLAVQHAIDRVLTEADSLEDAVPGVLKTLGENLGWQMTVLWMAEEEALRCVEAWHEPNAAPKALWRRACGLAVCVVKVCLAAHGQRTDPCGPGLRYRRRGSLGMSIRRRVGCGAPSPFPLPGVVDHTGSSSS